MNKTLHGKRALITGASGALGSAIARRLAAIAEPSAPLAPVTRARLPCKGCEGLFMAALSRLPQARALKITVARPSTSSLPQSSCRVKA